MAGHYRLLQKEAWPTGDDARLEQNSTRRACEPIVDLIRMVPSEEGEESFLLGGDAAIHICRHIHRESGSCMGLDG